MRKAAIVCCLLIVVLFPSLSMGQLCSVSAGFSGNNSQQGRIFRDGFASTCLGKVYPGIFNAGTPYYYETYTYSNTTALTLCVTVNFDPNAGGTPCATNAHAVAYLNSYDPANQSANYVGDVGSSVTQPFSFNVPPGDDLVLVVTNTASEQTCSFGFEVVGLPCETPAATIPTLSDFGLLLLALLICMVAVLKMRPRGNELV